MKQRLVGTIVIGCLAIIFIPVLLDGEGVTPAALNTNIPDAPPMPSTPSVTPVRPDISADTVTPDPVSTPEPASGTETESAQTSSSQTGSSQTNDVTSEPPPAPERPRLTSAGVPETWAVRLGSFGEMANAEALVQRLRDNDYKAFSRPIQSSRGPLTGVYVGPVLTKSQADSMQQNLAQAFQLEGIVVQFSIDDLEE